MKTTSLALTVLLLSTSIVLLNTGCKKNSEPIEIQLNVNHHVDGIPLSIDSIMYQNAAGNQYGVTMLRYYLSEFRFLKSDGSEVTVSSEVKYVDVNEETPLVLIDVPEGSYVGIAFNFGIPKDLNLSLGLPSTYENVHMYWPEPMGGGYHFMRFEGHFRTSATETAGFTIHLGTDTCLAPISIQTPFDIAESGEMTIGFNLNKIMESPDQFNMDSVNYTMGNVPVMYGISRNLQNAFTLETAP